MKGRILIIIFFVCTYYSLNAQSIIVKGESRQVFEQYVQTITPHRYLPINKLITKTAIFFLGKPYIESTLDTNIKEEQLTVNLTEFDCTTFVESCIALSLTMRSYNNSLLQLPDSIKDTAFNRYCYYLQLLRYRNGLIDGYSSRLHYMTDWTYDAINKNLLTDISMNLGGIKSSKKINFMSSHPQYYKQLMGDKEKILRIKQTEIDINNRNNYLIIPKEDIKARTNLIESGDIIIFATSLDGLDYSHVAIAYKTDEKLSFMHASSKAGKVVIESKSLNEYCLALKRNIGISVLRLR